MMSRQLKVNGEGSRIRTILANCQRVADRVFSYTNHREGYFSLVIQTEMVPADWANAAFALKARRHDDGFGEKSFSVWIFPVAQAVAINRKFGILMRALSQQAAVPASVLANNRPALSGAITS
jgi:hypothetical protein